MIATMNARPTIGVSDLNKAKAFYEDILGLELAEENPYVLMFKSGNGMVEVYKTDFDSEVTELLTKGVGFEHYDDMPGVTREGEVHTMGDEKAAWFKDPDGNILCLHQ